MSALFQASAWQRVQQVPHRAYFTAGVVSVLLLALWWSIALPLAGVSAQPVYLVHGLLMPLGIFPPFMLGFIFTAGPKWLGAEPPAGHFALAVGHVLGLLMCLLGFVAGSFWALLGLGVLFLVWWRATWLWYQCMHSAPTADQRHARCILLAMMAGNVALMLVAAWVLSGDGEVWMLARDTLVWGWITPIFLTVAHRMIPFFTQAVIPQRAIWRPQLVLYGALACCTLLVAGGLSQVAVLTFVAASVLTIGSAFVAWRWAGGQLRGACGGNRLLAMLHLSFAWLPVTFALLALGAVGVNVGSAPWHAIGMGFCLTMMIGFVTRVTLGHSGRPLIASNIYWRLYLALHVLAALRVVLALVMTTVPLSPHVLHLLAALWLLVLAVWACQVMPAYWQIRADGKAG